jgi:hypothetical protein
MPWSDDEDDDSSADESSSLHSDSEHDSENGGKKSKGIWFAASCSYAEFSVYVEHLADLFDNNELMCDV